MSIRITDLFEHMQGQFQGSGYISLGNQQYPNLITIYFGMTDRPSRDQAEKIANALIASGHLLEACA